MRLVNADALLSELEKYNDLSAREKNEYLFGMQQRLETCIELVEDAPTVDAVPVDDVLALATALSKEIEVLGLSVRAYHALSRWACRTVGDVYRLLKSGEIKKVRNLGDKSIGDIEDRLREYLPYLWRTDGRKGR